MPEIFRMTIIEARNALKVHFPKIVADMNNLGAINAEQRAGWRIRTQNAVEEEIRRDAVAARRRARSVTGDEIEMIRPVIRRRLAASSGPIAGPSARNTARRRDRASIRGRGGRSTRSGECGLIVGKRME